MLFNETTVIDEKSFHNFTLGNPVKKVSIIFGTNGSGKSSFCSSLVHQFKDKMRLFDTAYVKDNIQVQDIQGSRLLTKEQLKKQDGIKQLEDKKREAQENLRSEEQELEDNRKELYRIVSQTLEDGKKQFDNVNIKQKKGAKDNPEAALSQWYKDAENNSEAVGDENLAALNEKAELLQNQVQEIKPINLDNRIKDKEYIHTLLGSSYAKPGETLTDEIIKWLKQGEKIHDLSGAEEQCLFCGSTFEVKGIVSRIDQRINNNYADAVQKVADSIEALSSLERALDLIYPSKDYNDERDEALAECRHLLDLMHEKQKDMQKRIDGNTDKLIKYVESLSNKMSDTKSASLKEIQRIKGINDHKEAAAKSWIGKQLMTNIPISLNNTIGSLIGSIKTLNSAIDSLQRKISDAQQESSSMKPFEKCANEALRATGADFRLHLQKDDTFQVLCNSGNPNSPKQINAEDLSEGEIRLLGFIHFMISIHNSADFSDIKDGIQLILIDDPVTSLDADNRYYITDQINEMIDDVCNGKIDIQLIVLTHSSMDSHNLGFRHDDITRLEISKDLKRSSQLIVVNNKQTTYSDYYSSVFRELVEFEILNKQEVSSFSSSLQYPAKMRFIFETHARTHYNLQYTQKSDLNKICDCYETPKTKKFKARFEGALVIINSLAHGSSLYDQAVNEQSPREIQAAIRIILCVLFEKDKQHVRAMCSDEQLRKFNDVVRDFEHKFIDNAQS